MTQNNGIYLFEACSDHHVIQAVARTTGTRSNNAEVTSWLLTGVSNGTVVTVIEHLSGSREQFQVHTHDYDYFVDADGLTTRQARDGTPLPIDELDIEDAIELVVDMVPYPALHTVWVYADSARIATAILTLEPSGKGQPPNFKVMVLANSPQCAQVAKTLDHLSPDHFWKLVNDDVVFPATHAIYEVGGGYATLCQIQGNEPPALFCYAEFSISVPASRDWAGQRVISFQSKALFLGIEDLATHGQRADEIAAMLTGERILDLVDTGNARAFGPQLRTVLSYIPGLNGDEPSESLPTADLTSATGRPCVLHLCAGAEPVF